MKAASAISTGLHAAVLLWAAVSFTGKTFPVTPAESLPVDLINDKQFSELMKGAKDAPKKETPKPLVEKKEEQPKPVQEIKPKLEEKKKELEAAAEKPPEPAPQPPPKPDRTADKPVKQEEPKQEAKVQQPQPLPPRRPPVPQKPQPKFEPDKIAALLDKREATRHAAAGAAPTAPSLGAATGDASRLSASEIDALRARLMALWNPPVGIQNPEDFIIRVRIKLGRDGRLNGPPTVLTSGQGALYNSARDSAIRAVFRGQPFDMLKPEHYDSWKDIEVTFDPKDMFRG